MIVVDSTYKKTEPCHQHSLWLPWKNWSCHAWWWFMPWGVVVPAMKKLNRAMKKLVRAMKILICAMRSGCTCHEKTEPNHEETDSCHGC